MFCKNCGNQLNDAAEICPKCGVPVVSRPQVANIPNHMAGAIITALFCLIPGIFAIVYACKVNDKLAQGDYDGAMSASKAAYWWTTGTAIAAGVLIVFGAIFGAVAG